MSHVTARKLRKKGLQGLGWLASRLKCETARKTWPIAKRVDSILDKLGTLVHPELDLKPVGDLLFTEHGLAFVLCNGSGEDGLARVSCDAPSFKVVMAGTLDVVETTGNILGASCECSVHRKRTSLSVSLSTPSLKADAEITAAATAAKKASKRTRSKASKSKT